MRSCVWMLALVMLWTFCGCRTRTIRQPKASAFPTGAPKEVAGIGSSEETARKNALTKAAQKITDFMQAQNPPLRSFVVNEEFVQTNVAERGKAGDVIKEDFGGEKVESFKWILPLKPIESWWKELVQRDYEVMRQQQEADRKVRAVERQTQGAEAVLGIACLLLAGWGYVRLDEYTQRRYTGWLRLAGVGVATTIAAGLWWVFFVP